MSRQKGGVWLISSCVYTCLSVTTFWIHLLHMLKKVEGWRLRQCYVATCNAHRRWHLSTTLIPEPPDVFFLCGCADGKQIDRANCFTPCTCIIILWGIDVIYTMYVYIHVHVYDYIHDLMLWKSSVVNTAGYSAFTALAQWLHLRVHACYLAVKIKFIMLFLQWWKWCWEDSGC